MVTHSAPINRPTPLTKVLKPCPPTNKDFSCDNVHTSEGIYQLINDIHFDTIAPQYSTGTQACIVDVQTKHSIKSSSSATSSLTDSATLSTPTPISSSNERIYNYEENNNSIKALQQQNIPTATTMNPAFSSASLPAPPPIVSISTTLKPLSSSHLSGHVSPLDTSFDIVRSTALPIPTTTNHHLTKTIYEEKIDEEYAKGNHGKDNGSYNNEDDDEDDEEENNHKNINDDDEEESEKNSHGTITPPYSRFTPTSHFLNPLTSLSNANNHSHLVAAMTTPTPTSSTSFLHSSPSHSQQQYQHSPNTSSSLIPSHSVNDQYHHPSSLTSNTSSSTSTNLDNNTSQQNYHNHSNTTIADLSTSVSSISSLFSRRNSVRYINSPQRKPKNNLTKTKSSFVLKMIIHERLAHILANRHVDDSYIFFNIGTSFIWMDSKGKPKVNYIYIYI